MSELGSLAFSRVMREHLHDEAVVELAHELHVRLPEGEAHNNVIIVKEHGTDNDGQMLGMAVLTPSDGKKPGSLMSQAEAVVQTAESLNGSTEMVQNALTSYVGRIARERGFSYMRVSNIAKEQVEMKDGQGRALGHQMTQYYPVAKQVIRL